MANSTPLHDIDALPAASTRSERSRSLIVYWHLLSLDAPTVAMLWTWFIAKSNGAKLPLTSILAMGVAVWVIYAADRLLDARSASDSHLELRHLFHRSHRQAFRAVLVLAALALVVLVSRLNPAVIRLYTILSAPLIGYFTLIHLRKNFLAKPMPRLPKELAVGMFFAAATFIPAVACNSALRQPLFPAAVLFGLTCSLNCLFIYAWEHPVTALGMYPEAHPATRLALRFLPCVAILVIASGLGLALNHGVSNSSGSDPWQLSLAMSLAAALLLQLHSLRRHLGPTALRAAADLCLLTPILFALTLPS